MAANTPNTEIVDILNKKKNDIRIYALVDTLEYLKRGGRISSVQAIAGNIINLKPIIRVLDNKMVVAKKPMGYSRGLNALLGYLEADKDNIDEDMMTITHCLADKDAEYLKNEIPNIVSHNNLMETHAGCVVSTHCGPRCIGILYILKHPENN